MKKKRGNKNVVVGMFLGLVCLSVVPGYGQGNTVTIPLGTGISTTEFRTSSNVPTQVFHARVDGASPPSGYEELHYTLPNTAGQLSELSVALKGTMRNGRFYAENDGLTRVGIAFSNPNPQAVALSFFFTDSSGSNVASGNTTIPENGQLAAFLGEAPFNAPAAFRGTFTFNTSAPVGAFAVRGYVNEVGLFLMPQVPIVDLGNVSMTSSVPYFENDRIHATDLILVNPTDTTLSGAFTFLDQGATNAPAQPVAVTIDGQTSSAFQYSIPTRTSHRFATSARTDDVFYKGSIQIAPISGSQLPAAFAILSIQDAAAVIRYQNTIMGQAPATAFQLPVRGLRFGGPLATFTTQTRVVITNPSSTAIGVSIDLASMNASTTLTVPAGGQIQITPEGEFQFSNVYNGVLRISSSSPISVVGLQSFINQFGGPMAVEALDESVPPPSDLIFPHLVVGPYRSSLLLLKTSQGQSSEATIRFFSQTGIPVDPKDFGLQP